MARLSPSVQKQDQRAGRISPGISREPDATVSCQCMHRARCAWEPLPRFLDYLVHAAPLASLLTSSVLRLFMIGGLNLTHEWFDPKGKSVEAVGAEITRIVLGKTGPSAKG